MKLSFKLFGIEVARLDLELPADDPRQVTTLDKGVKGMSNWWVRRMNK